MRVDDSVLRCVVEGGPVAGTLEVVLDHHGNALVHFGKLGKNAVEVGVDPVGIVERHTSGRTKASEVIECLIDRGDCKGVHVVAALGELQNTIHSPERIIEAGSIVEPSSMEDGLTNIEVFHATKERVKADNDVHAVIGNGVVRYRLKELLMVIGIQLRIGNGGPCCICSRIAKVVDYYICELVDGAGVEKAA
jgi:hypothetical protein